MQPDECGVEELVTVLRPGPSCSWQCVLFNTFFSHLNFGIVLQRRLKHMPKQMSLYHQF